ncbi:MAG: ATP-binding protein [Actinomycetota bacterium]
MGTTELLLAAACLVAIVVAVRARRSAGHDADAVARADRARAASQEALDAERTARGDLLAAIDAMEDGVVLFGADGAVLEANAAAERLLAGRPSAAAALAPVALQGLVAAAADGPAVLDLEVGAPTRVLRGSARRSGDAGQVLLVLRDVTDAVRIDAIRRDFVANASHELKTPVATIRATAETLGAAAVDDPAAVSAFAARIEDEAVRLARIVADLLDLSRLEGGSDLVGEADLAAILAEEAARLAPEAAAATVELTTGGGATARVRGSERDLALLVRNLLDNAVRYATEGGHVRASVTAADGEVVLEVADDGVGIPTRDLPRVFERFYRVDRGRSRETGGTGLGLAIVRHVAENHGGRATIESELGRGTTVRVHLPPLR